MEVKPIHIIGASIVAFAVIVGANLLVSWRGVQEVKDRFAGLGTDRINAIREQRVAEEQMVEVGDDD